MHISKRISSFAGLGGVAVLVATVTMLNGCGAGPLSEAQEQSYYKYLDSKGSLGRAAKGDTSVGTSAAASSLTDAQKTKFEQFKERLAKECKEEHSGGGLNSTFLFAGTLCPLEASMKMRGKEVGSEVNMEIEVRMSVKAEYHDVISIQSVDSKGTVRASDRGRQLNGRFTENAVTRDYGTVTSEYELVSADLMYVKTRLKDVYVEVRLEMSNGRVVKAFLNGKSVPEDKMHYFKTEIFAFN